MPDLIASTPWYIPSTIALCAVILIFQGNARQNPKLKRAGLVCALLAATIIVLSQYLESDSEKVVRRTTEMVQAADQRDWNKFASYLDKDVTFAIYQGRETLKNGAEKTITDRDIKNIGASNFNIRQENGEYVVDFTAMAEIAEAGRRVPTNWRLYWIKSNGAREALLYRIEYVESAQVSGNDVRSRLK